MSEFMQQQTAQVSLSYLVHLAETGRLRPAPFSRPQVWGREQVADLFDSICRGYPVGTLFVAPRPANAEEFLLGNLRINAPQDDGAWIIIDGLQRITAIANVLSSQRSEYGNSDYDLYFDPSSAALVSEDSASSPLLPLHIAMNRGTLAEWLDEHPFQRNAETEACRRLAGRLSSYLIAMTQLEQEDLREVTFEVFTRLNSAGVPLTRSDLTRARSAQVEDRRTGLPRLQSEVERLGFGSLSAELAAECALAVLEPHSEFAAPPSARVNAQAMFQRLPPGLRQRTVDKAQKAINTAIQFLSLEASIPHIRLLPQRGVLVTLVRLINLFGAPSGRQRELLRRWVWRSGTMPLDLTSIPPEIGEVPDDRISAATALLDSLSQTVGLAWQPEPGELSLNDANGRLNTLGLLSENPSLLVPTDDQAELAEVIAFSDVPVSSARILIPWLEESDSLFCELLPPNATRAHRPSLGAYLLHPSVMGEKMWHYVLSEGGESNDKLATHHIDGKAWGLLRTGDFDQFIKYRESLMIRTISRYVQSMARWGFRDHGTLPKIVDTPFGDGQPDES